MAFIEPFFEVLRCCSRLTLLAGGCLAYILGLLSEESSLLLWFNNGWEIRFGPSLNNKFKHLSTALPRVNERFPCSNNSTVRPVLWPFCRVIIQHFWICDWTILALRFSYGAPQRLPRIFDSSIEQEFYTTPPGVPVSLTYYIQHHDQRVFLPATALTPTADSKMLTLAIMLSLSQSISSAFAKVPATVWAWTYLCRAINCTGD